MDFIDLIKNRRSCRKFLDKNIEIEKIKKILEAGRIAPTACNNQPQRILVLNEQESLEKLKKITNFYGAPLVLIICGDKDVAWTRNFDKKNSFDIDSSIVTTYMMLEAETLDLNSVWICYFDPKKIKDIFNLPENLEAVNILAIGYSNQEKISSDRYSTDRLPIEKTTFFNKI